VSGKTNYIKRSVFFRLNIFTILTLVILVILTISMTKKIVRPKLESRFLNMASQAGHTILAEFSKDLSKAKTLSKVLAKWSETAEQSVPLYKRTLPVLINLKAEGDFIAGGGVWPEPYAFDKNIARRSFFWGRNKSGILEYFDDYNDIKGAGYHNEEWYVPVKLLPKNTVYWSQAYTDPYTLQPMVTCSTPIYIKSQFSGVSTIDIKLDGLQESIQQVVAKFHGYGFVLDRFNQVVFYSREIKLPKNKILYGYNDILETSESYKPVIKTVLSLETPGDKFTENQKILIEKIKSSFSGEINGLSEENINLLSFDMSNKILLEEGSRDKLIDQINIKDDPILEGGSTAFVFYMPTTNWKMILFLPQHDTELAISSIVKDISWFQTSVIVLMFLSGAWLMHLLIAKPLKQMIFQLKGSTNEKEGDLSRLTVKGKGEIAELVTAFNNKTTTLSDVLKEVRTLEAEKSKRLLDFTQSINDAIIVINSDGEIVFWNKAASNIFGYTVDDILYTSINCIIPDEFQVDHSVGLIADVQLGEIKQDDTIFELPAITKNGEALLVELTVSASTSNGVKIFTVILRDITLRKKAEDDLKKANQSKSEFLSNMSHELRTPMHAILSYSGFGVSRIDKAGREKLLKYFQQINTSGQRLLLLLNDLLDMSKLEAGKMELTIEESNLFRLVETCVIEVQSLAEARKTDILVSNIAQPIYLEMDYARISQVVINLLSNAIKFTEDSSCIKVVFADSEINHHKAVLLSIEDQGHGIPENELATIFDKFIQSSQTNTGAGGTGLGLSICKEIIDIHHGEIWAENSPDGGAVFYMLLPLKYQK